MVTTIPRPTTQKSSKFVRFSGRVSRAVEPREVQGGAGLIVPVVILTEGEFIDANGVEFAETPATLALAQESTLAYMAAGNDIPVFASPHYFDGGYKDENIVGQLTQEFRIETFTKDNLPDPRMTDLLGKQGLFGELLLVDPSAIETYQQRRAAGMSTKISAGSDSESGEMTGYPMAIMEISQVAWGAVPAARMLSKPGTYAALTMDGAISESSGYEMFWPIEDAIYDLCSVFTKVMKSIVTTTEEELQGRDRDQLKAQALTDYVALLRDRLGLTRQPPPGVTAARPLATGTIKTMADNNPTPTPEDKAPVVDAALMQELQERITALETDNQAKTAELETMKAQQETADAVVEQKQRAEALVASKRLTRAQFKNLFPDGETVNQAAGRFMSAVEGNKFSGPAGLIRLESYLDAAAESTPVGDGGTVRGSQGLGDNPAQDTSAQDDADAGEYATNYRKTHPVRRSY